MAIKLYHNPRSRAAMSHWLLEEIGAPYALAHVDYEDGSMRSEEFLAINPMGKIPALVDGQTIVTENIAIAIYLADKYKSPNDLAPAIDHPQRGEYLRWVAFQSGAIEPAMMAAGQKLDVERRQAGWGSVDLVLDVLDQKLSGPGPYLLGDWFTAADVVLGGALSWATGFGLFEKRPSFEAYIGRLASRPAFQKAFGGTD